ncbi:MAG: hypothetical protein RL322_2666 [Pseudomonadota bacterium]
MAYTKPLPVLDGENAPHWAGARERQVRVQRCGHCERLRFPAARYCSNCLSEESEWITLSGRGEIWSHCRFHRVYFKGFEDEMPYTVVLVRLDEGPLLYSNIVGLDERDVRIGMRVRAVFDDVTESVTLIKFAPE